MSTNNEHIEFKTPILDSLKGKNGFAVPKGYFNQLEGEVKEQLTIASMESTLPKALTKETPSNYFATLEARVKEKINKEESILDQLKGKNGFAVPQGYFDELPSKIEKQEEEKGKVVRLFSIKHFAYAASVAALLTIGFFMFNNNKEGLSLEGTLASNNSTEIIDSEEKLLAFNSTLVADYFDNMVENDIDIDGIVFEDINIEETDDQEDFMELFEQEIEEELNLDPTELIELENDDFDLFEF